jgi:transcription antitermination factor NusG
LLTHLEGVDSRPQINTNLALSRECEDLKWYAAYTRSRHEKVASVHCAQRSIQTWLPTYEALRRWKDRRVLVRFPLFPGYVFVRIPLQDRIKVLEVPGIVRLVGFGGLPTPLTDREVLAVQSAMTCASRRIEPCAFLRRGTRVRIVKGPFQGLFGVVLRTKGSLRVLVQLELINRAFSLEVAQSEICVHSRARDIRNGEERPCAASSAL